MTEFLLMIPVYIVLAYMVGGGIFLLLTYLFWYYEYANRRVELKETSGPSEENELSGVTNIVCRPRIGGVDSSLPTPLWKVILSEGIAGTTSLIMYPFGIKDEPVMPLDLDSFPDLGMEPVVLVHGYLMNRSNYFVLKLRLEQDFGINLIYNMNLHPMFGSIPEIAEEFMRRLEDLAIAWKHEKFQLIVHSMAGIVVRYAIMHLGGGARISRVISLGSPHYGTKLAVFGIGENARGLHPASGLIKSLQSREARQPQKIPPWISIGSVHDNMLLPFDCAIWEHSTANLLVEGMGHSRLLFDPDVAWIVGALLSMPKWDRQILQSAGIPENFCWIWNAEEND